MESLNKTLGVRVSFLSYFLFIYSSTISVFNALYLLFPFANMSHMFSTVTEKLEENKKVKTIFCVSHGIL